MRGTQGVRRVVRTGRRVFPVAVCGVASLALAACGGESSSDSGSAAAGDRPAWCGTKSIVLGLQDGGGMNAWSKAAISQMELEAKKCPAVERTILVKANFDTQKAISGLNGLVAQGANAIAIIPDAGGAAELPAIKNATRRGVKVVLWGTDPEGVSGRDFVDYVDWDAKAAGKRWAQWLVEALDGKGNIVHLGGPPGNAVDRAELEGALEVFDQHPGMRLITGRDEWGVTNWDPALTRKVMSGLIAQHDRIDGIYGAEGVTLTAAIEALRAANRPIPAITTLEANGLACTWKKYRGTKNEFPLATTSARTWLGRVAVRKAVAAASGLKEDSKAIIDLPLYEDSRAGGDKAPKCDPSQPPDALLSNRLPDRVFDELTAP
jgi:ribose transport system substrate-binding protein